MKKIYDNLPKRLAFFPNFYRFFASIALNLEGLSLAGDHAETICARINQQGLGKAELPDLQHAKTMRLLMRRCIGGEETNLQARWHRIINHSAIFALLNSKAVYVLTHIVFYLSEFCRSDLKISADAVQSLIFCGILAHFDQNADLLTEVCIALRIQTRCPHKHGRIWLKRMRMCLRSFYRMRGLGTITMNIW